MTDGLGTVNNVDVTTDDDETDYVDLRHTWIDGTISFTPYELREIADLKEEYDAEPDLPEFNGYQMAEELYTDGTASIYRDEDGDVWVEDGNDDGAACLDGSRKDTVAEAWGGDGE